jgi:nicotinate-nucleotide pyrophosphorylase (carboxylating)
MHTTRELIDMALKEDIGSGDITTASIVDPSMKGRGIMTAKEPLILAGRDVAEQVFLRLESDIRFRSVFKDGDAVDVGETILEIGGGFAALLMGERTALNFIQRLSGIATNVRGYVEALAGSRVKLVDTRKTTPSWRVLEKYAVRVGGAYNHRMGLYDGVLIKDNHIAVAGGIEKAVKRVRANVSHLVKIEVETSSLPEVRQALHCDADVIMLDNMDRRQIEEAVALIDGKALVEVSGGVTRDNVAELAETGVDMISVGAFTHSSPSVDISMAIQPG